MVLKILLAALFVATTNAVETGNFGLLMPNTRPSIPDAYLCTPIRILNDKNYYITHFTPNATSETAHHMLIYGCEKPGKTDEVWNCGEMAQKDKQYDSAPPCQAGSQIVYAWAHNAPDLQLPEGVGFKVGGKSDIQYLVLQVHYLSVTRFEDGVTTDDSGVLLHYTDVPQPRSAGVFLLGTNGNIPANSVTNMETACEIDDARTIHPFAFRTHTHSLGSVVSGYKVQRHRSGHQWTVLGKGDPQMPQMFYSMKKDNTLTKGDIVAARCTMESKRGETTYVGPTASDEMCNFYLMYWVKGEHSMKQKYCFSMGPPLYYWTSPPYFLNNIPPDASIMNY